MMGSNCQLSYSVHLLKGVRGVQRNLDRLDGGGGAILPGIFQEMTGHATYWYSLVDMVVFGQGLDSIILKIFSNLNSSVIL